MLDHRIFRLPISSIFLLLLLTVSQSAIAGRISELRVWNAPERSRVVIELDKAPTYKRFFLNNPSRFVVDFSDFTLSAKELKKVQNGVFFKAVRSGQPNKNTARVVLDLNQEVNIKVTLLKPAQGFRYRLLLDVHPASTTPKVDQSVAKITKPATSNGVEAPPLAVAKSQPSPAVPQSSPPMAKPFIIAIDAGHGGEDSGALGRRSQEKKIVLQIAKRLKKKIDARKGMKAVLTRKGDYFIPLRERTRIARKAGADLFVSIHADAFKNRSARGSSVFALSLRGASSETAKWLANRENAADLAGGVSIASRDHSVAKILLDLSMESTQHESISFAASVLSELKKIGKVHKKHVEKAGFAVLKSPDIPSILVETAFITNSTEEKLLLSASHQEKLANAIFIGALNYLKGSHYHTVSFNQ